MTGKRALIFANGSLPDENIARKLVKPGDVLIAADGGARHLLDLGFSPTIIIGDLDSFPPEPGGSLKSGPQVIQYPRDKEETDLELALLYAFDQEYAPIRIIAALGGRLDQTLGNLSLLTSSAWQERDIRMDDGQEEVFFTRSKAEWQGMPGDTVSLLPWGASVSGVVTCGLKWKLTGDTLAPDKTRGISNEMVGKKASVQIKSGLLLVVHTRQITPQFT